MVQRSVPRMNIHFLDRRTTLPGKSIYGNKIKMYFTLLPGFFQFVVRPLFTLWHRMMSTPLSTNMMHNLDTNQDKWTKLLQTDSAQEARAEAANQEESEIPEHVLEDSDTISIGVAKIAAKVARHEDRLAANSMRTRPAVRFDPHTTITAASDSEQSEDGEMTPETAPNKPISSVGRESDFLGIPRPDGRRHSIATGLMPIPPAQLLSAAGIGGGGGGLGACRSSSSLNVSEMVSSSNTRMVGRTVIRRESLPSGSLLAGRALPSKTILHLQKLSKGDSGSSASGDLSPAESMGAVASTSSVLGEAGSPTAEVPASPAKLAEKSSCSSSTTDEILDFTFSLPEPGSRSSGSPRRSTLEATDLDELCPGTSILSMSPNVAHFTLQQSIDMEDQRRHLIRQQTCPVVSIHGEGGGKFDRPRFLSAAAAVSPTAVASSSIISQHRVKNRSPETASGGSSGGEEGAVGGIPMGQERGSGGSSSEAIMQCGVISEEGDRGSGGSSAEASPLEIFVQQFPPGADDNDGQAPRRASSTGNLESDQLNINEYGSSSCASCGGSTVNCDCYSSNLAFANENCLMMKTPLQPNSVNYFDERADNQVVPGANSSDCLSEEPLPFQNDLAGEINFLQKTHLQECHLSRKSCRGESSCFSKDHADGEHTFVDNVNMGEVNCGVTDTVNTPAKTTTQTSSTFTSAAQTVPGTDKPREGSDVTQDISTQTEPLVGGNEDLPTDSNQDEEEGTLSHHPLSDGLIATESGSTAIGISHTTTSTMSTSRGTSTDGSNANPDAGGSQSANSNRLATLLMWKNNRLWRSLTEEDHEENPCISDLDLEENISPPNFYDRWNIRLTTTQPTHQVGFAFYFFYITNPKSSPHLSPFFQKHCLKP